VCLNGTGAATGAVSSAARSFQKRPAATWRGSATCGDQLGNVHLGVHPGPRAGKRSGLSDCSNTCYQPWVAALPRAVVPFARHVSVFGVGQSAVPAPEHRWPTRGLHGRAQVNLDKRDNLTWNAGNLRAERIDLQSRGDTRIEGVSLDAGRIGGEIGGDLHIASRKDSVDSLSVKADARLSQEKNPQGYVNAASSVAGPLGSKVSEKAGSALSKADPGLSPTLSLEVSREQRDTVARQATLKGSEGIDLRVGGDAHLVGAKLQSAKGDVALNANAVSRETLSGNDYRRDVSIDASNSPVDLGTAIAEMAKGKGAAGGEQSLDLGLLRTSGHSRSEQWTSTVQGKED